MNKRHKSGTAPWDFASVKESAIAASSQKIAAGEKVVMKPVKVNELLDITGNKFGILSPFYSGWTLY